MLRGRLRKDLKRPNIYISGYLLHGDCLQQSKKTKMTIKKKSNSRKKENLISKITTLLKSNIQFRLIMH